MEEQFLLFMKSQNLQEGLEQLKECLKKSSQINYYDLIYNQYIKNNSNIFNEKLPLNSVIPGLNRSIYLMIFTCYYRHLLKGNIRESKVFLKTLEALLQDENIMYDNISIAYHELYFNFILSKIPSEDEEYEEYEYKNFK